MFIAALFTIARTWKKEKNKYTYIWNLKQKKMFLKNLGAGHE